MPKSTSASSRPALRRNQACLSCRKRKLKCDAARPHCGTCLKQWQTLISVPPPVGYAHPTEPQCSYDPIEGLPVSPNIDPMDRIRQLEDQISQLKRQLNDARGVSRTEYPRHLQSTGPQSTAVHSPTRSPSGGNPNFCYTPPVSVTGITNSPNSQPRAVTASPGTQQFGVGQTDALTDVLVAGWDPDLPQPEVLTHLIDVFFRCDPCGSRMLHRPSFLASMHLRPNDPNFPHSAVLHAICASASRWASHDIMTLPDGTRRDRFAELHVSKTRTYIDRTMATGQDIFPVMQACVLLSWYFYQEGRWVEVWIFAGFQTRVAVPLRLNYPGTFSLNAANGPGAYLDPPKDFRELELRRRTWWMTVMFDRIVSVGGWLHGVDDRDIGTELPLRSIDFETGSGILSNPQHLATKDVFIRHIPEYTDSCILFLKAVMLFGRVTDYNTRSNLRTTAPPSKDQNPFNFIGFEQLDKLVSLDFLASFPPEYRHLGIRDDGSALDTDLYMAHVVPHAHVAIITLHNPYINFHNSSNVSAARCVAATRYIISAYYRLSETSLDTTRLHPFITICWYLAAVVQIQLCKYFIEIGDVSREGTVWEELNVLRFAMLTYGSRSPIGVRQEKLLQGVMTEIVRMTSQMHPLQVTVPLYPFSHAGVFPRDGNPIERTGAPLPGSQILEELSPTSSSSSVRTVHMPSGMINMSSSSSVTSGWSVHHTPNSSPTTHTFQGQGHHAPVAYSTGQ